HTTNGKLDIKAGTHIKEVTTVYEMSAPDIVFKSKGGTIKIDASGITLKGNVTIKGNVAISGGSGGGAKAINLTPNEGKGFDERPHFFNEDGTTMAALAYKLLDDEGEHEDESKKDGSGGRAHTETQKSLDMSIDFIDIDEGEEDE
ncbi:MAG TPA: hypothetical protein EYG82_00540, partial [Sulfurovum sp.]|nr:hypothetical protein [Sulfurovum sp.]